MIVTLNYHAGVWEDSNSRPVACGDYQRWTGTGISAKWHVSDSPALGYLELQAFYRLGRYSATTDIPMVRVNGALVGAHDRLIEILEDAGCEWQDGVLTAYVRRIDEITEPEGSQPKE